ncbi:MAG: hypothetical protein ACO3JL_19175, partial [Myxococcota bacterium]
GKAPPAQHGRGCAAMMTARRLATAIVLGLQLAGCCTVQSSLPGTLRTDVSSEDMTPVGSFDHEETHAFVPCGLGTSPETEMRKALLAEAHRQQADGVAELSFTVETSPLSCLVGRICPVFQTRTYRLRGKLVRLQVPALPGTVPQEAPPAGAITVERAERGSTTTAVAY